MDFQYSDLQEEIRQLTRKFARGKIRPQLEEDEKDEKFRPEWIEELGGLGLCAIPTPQEFGGMGLGYLEYVIAIEELARESSAYAVSIAVSGLPQIIINTYGNQAQKEKYIPPMASGKAIGAFSLSEASSGSDAGSLLTTAKKEKDYYILNGTKLWVTQGDFAETIILMARTGEAGHRGISSFILEKGMAGFKTGKREKKMAMSVSHTMELVLENVKIPATNLIGEEGQGFKIALSALDSGRITIGASSLGISKAALAVAVSHAREREQFGKPIGSFQGISFMLADMATQIDAAELLIQRAAFLKDQGKPFVQEAAMAKLFATDMAMKVTTDAVQILGGSGYTQEFPVERYMREAKVGQIVEGTNQIQRLVIGRELLKN